jgi:predicted outer membrane repeat protein
MRSLSLVAIALVCAFSAIAFSASTDIPAGSIQGEWTENHSPYMIQGNVVIPEGQTLTIGPRVKVFFTGHYKLTVNGILKAEATENGSNAIWFTADLAANPAGWAGIRFVNSKDSKLEHCVIENARASGEGNDRLGGAIYCENSNPAISNCVVQNNIASGSGGGAACVGGKPSFSNCTFSGNSATESGGAIFGDHSKVNLGNCLIEKNQAGTDGGGLAAVGGTIVRMVNSTFSENTGGISGGAMSANASMVDMADGILKANVRGAVAIVGGSTVRLSNCDILQNKNMEHGGGVSCKASTLTLMNATIDENSQGGVYLADNSKADLTNCRIRGNGEKKSVEYDANSTASMNNCSVKD